jgi:flagellin-like hook-associated protein FlgL|tara:strand:+ start:237 stop:467 length:231 start_codon:yes stop_codon:yes gene_type:complete
MPTKDDVISNIQTITKQMNEILLIIKENKRKGINEGNKVNLLALKEIQSNLNKLKKQVTDIINPNTRQTSFDEYRF